MGDSRGMFSAGRLGAELFESEEGFVGGFGITPGGPGCVTRARTTADGRRVNIRICSHQDTPFGDPVIDEVTVWSSYGL